eukprot:365148-Chlamydomonas_euryale.AAC.3
MPCNSHAHTHAHARTLQPRYFLLLHLLDGNLHDSAGASQGAVWADGEARGPRRTQAAVQDRRRNSTRGGTLRGSPRVEKGAAQMSALYCTPEALAGNVNPPPPRTPHTRLPHTRRRDS